MLKMAWYSKTYTLLTSVYNDLDDADDYSGVIGISKCEQKNANTHPKKCTHQPMKNPQPTHPSTHRHPSWMITISSAYSWA